MKGNPNWRVDNQQQGQYLAPGVTTNWDAALQQHLSEALSAAGIQLENLTDKDLVEQVGRWINATEHWIAPDDAEVPYELMIAYPNGVPTIVPELRNSFPTDGTTRTKEALIPGLVLGKEMVSRSAHWGGLSKAIYDATVFKALGIPARITMQLQVANTKHDISAMEKLNGLVHNQLREEWKRSVQPTWGLNFPLELFVGNRWVRYQNGVLGLTNFNAKRHGLYLDLGTYADGSEVQLPAAWMRNPYPPSSHTLVALQDAFGAHSRLENPQVASSDLTVVTVTGVLAGNDPKVPDFVRSRLKGSDLVLITDVEENDPSIYPRMLEFLRKAGGAILLKAPGQEDVFATISSGTISAGGRPSHIGLLVKIDPAEWSKVKPGVSYRLVPVPISDTYRIVIGEGVTFVRR